MLVDSDIGVMGDEELDRVTREEFGEEEEAMDKALGEMEEWIDSCPHLVNAKRDRQWLRSADTDIEGSLLYSRYFAGCSTEVVITKWTCSRRSMTCSTR